MSKKEKWLWFTVFVVASVIVCAFASCIAQASGPVESPITIRLPYEELRRAYIDLPLQDFARLIEPWESLVESINTANLFVYEAIRNPLVQTVNVTIYDTTPDTATAVFPKPFKDTTFVVTTGLNFGQVATTPKITKIDNQSVLVTTVVSVSGDSVKIGLQATGLRK